MNTPAMDMSAHVTTSEGAGGHLLILNPFSGSLLDPYVLCIICSPEVLLCEF